MATASKPAPPVTIPGIVEDFVNSLCIEKGLSDNTLQAYRSDLSTTQIYTHIANERVQQVIHQHHPRS